MVLGKGGRPADCAQREVCIRHVTGGGKSVVNQDAGFRLRQSTEVPVSWHLADAWGVRVGVPVPKRAHRAARIPFPYRHKRSISDIWTSIIGARSQSEAWLLLWLIQYQFP
jgi:hypothetical protein